MTKKLKIGHYINRGSVVHLADAKLKIAVFFVLAILTFFISRPIELLVGLALFLLFSALAKVNPLEVARSVWGILLFLVLLAALNMFVIQSGNELFAWWIVRITDEGIERAVIYAGRLAILLLLGGLLLATTSPISLTDGLGRIFSPLQKFGVPVQTLAMILSLAIRFVPVIADEASAIMTAQKSRGADLSKGGTHARLKSAISLILPTCMASLRHAENLSLALMSKSYEPGEPRTSWSYAGFKKRNNL